MFDSKIKFIHVLYNYLKNCWAVKIDDSKEIVFTSSSRIECIIEAKRLAKTFSAYKCKIRIQCGHGEPSEEIECAEHD